MNNFHKVSLKISLLNIRLGLIFFAIESVDCLVYYDDKVIYLKLGLINYVWTKKCIGT